MTGGIDQAPISARVAVIGCGNIGSHLVPHIGRMPGVASVVLIDFDTYETKNLISQAIEPADVGRPKAIVQAERLRAINPALEVTALVDRIEDVPPARLAVDLILTCLDGPAPRQQVNELAFGLNVPWIDAGVETHGLLVRVTAYQPSPDSPCLECAWADADYERIARAYPCDGGPAAAAPTNGVSSLGALAAGLQALACRHPRFGYEAILDAAHHRTVLSRLVRNSCCRFAHAAWLLAARVTATASAAAVVARSAQGDATLRVVGRWFAADLACAACGTRTAWSVVGRTARCPGCAAPLVVPGTQLHDAIAVTHLGELATRPLRDLGVRPGDVLRLRTAAAERYVAIAD